MHSSTIVCDCLAAISPRAVVRKRPAVDMEQLSDDSEMESSGSFDENYCNSSFYYFVCALLPLAFLLYAKITDFYDLILQYYCAPQSETGQHDTH